MFAEDARELRLPLVIRIAPFVLLIVGTLFIRVMRRTYTLNLGNPWSWMVIIVFVTGIAIPLLLVT